jgi:hypothetical protein
MSIRPLESDPSAQAAERIEIQREVLRRGGVAPTYRALIESNVTEPYAELLATLPTKVPADLTALEPAVLEGLRMARHLGEQFVVFQSAPTIPNYEGALRQLLTVFLRQLGALRHLVSIAGWLIVSQRRLHGRFRCAHVRVCDDGSLVLISSPDMSDGDAAFLEDYAWANDYLSKCLELVPSSDATADGRMRTSPVYAEYVVSGFAGVGRLDRRLGGALRGVHTLGMLWQAMDRPTLVDEDRDK